MKTRIWLALRVPAPGTRVVTLSVAVLCVALPLAMLQFPAYQGLIQRFMYLFVFAWLWACFPAHTAGPSFKRTASDGR